MSRFVAHLATALALAAFAAPCGAAPAARPAPARTEVAVFAGGCFWSMQTQFEGVKGVTNVVVGYTGGRTSHPTYEQVCSHTTGHLEAVQVTFDPAVTSYEQVLDRYWHSIDPTQADGQFCDIGESYQSAVFVRDPAQRRVAEASKANLEASHVLHAPIATRILPAATFWPAEGYHQAYARKHPAEYRAYRVGCGRDRHSAEVWGNAWAKPLGE